MTGIEEMFAELAGGDRYAAQLEAWCHYQRALANARQRRYEARRTPEGRAKRRAYHERVVERVRSGLLGSMSHGTRSAYVFGCRCEPCREAERAYQRAYARHRKPEQRARRNAASRDYYQRNATRILSARRERRAA